MSNPSCIFCKICNKTEPSELFFEDAEIVIFKDIKPATNHHYLAVSRNHIKSAAELTKEDLPLLNKLIEKGTQIVQEKGGDVNDIRLGFHWPPFNSISHLHLHVISPVSQMNFISRMIFKPNTWWFTSAEDVKNKLCKL